MEILIIITIIVGAVIVGLFIKLAYHADARHNDQTIARYEKVKNGQLSESDLNEQEKNLLQKLRAEKTCGDFDDSQLLLRAFVMHNHKVLPQNILQLHKVDLEKQYPHAYETCQNCYNSYCYYNSEGS